MRKQKSLCFLSIESFNFILRDNPSWNTRFVCWIYAQTQFPRSSNVCHRDAVDFSPKIFRTRSQRSPSGRVIFVRGLLRKRFLSAWVDAGLASSLVFFLTFSSRRRQQPAKISSGSSNVVASCDFKHVMSAAGRFSLQGCAHVRERCEWFVFRRCSPDKLLSGKHQRCSLSTITGVIDFYTRLVGILFFIVFSMNKEHDCCSFCCCLVCRASRRAVSAVNAWSHKGVLAFSTLCAYLLPSAAARRRWIIGQQCCERMRACQCQARAIYPTRQADFPIKMDSLFF